MKRIMGGIGVTALLAALGFARNATSEPTLLWSTGTQGSPGAIDTPTAGAYRDGEVVGSVSGHSVSQRANFSFQVFPPLTATVRFSREKGQGAGGTHANDLNLDLHLQLLREKGWRPAFAVGMRNIMGNRDNGGDNASEYLVASKTLTPRLRASAGIGWGRLGSDGTWGGGTRPAGSTDGGFDSDSWFKGPAGPFASIEWQASEKLTLKAEYSSDACSAEVAHAGFDRKTPINIGADYRLGNTTSVSGYLLHGSKIGFQFNIALDPREPLAPSGFEAAPVPVRPRPSPARDPGAWSTDWASDPTAEPAIQKSISDALRQDGQVLESMRLTAQSVDVRVSNETWRANPQAIGHTARILTRALPASVGTIRVTLVRHGMPASTTTFSRSDLEKMENGPSTQIAAVAKIGEARTGSTGYTRTPGLYPRLVWGIAPYLELSPFSTESGYHADLGVALSGRYELAPGLALAGAIHQKAIGSLGKNSNPSLSTAPHVRSNIHEYQKHGDLTVPYLTLTSYARPARDVYSRLTVGLLERMYGGVSGEMLWKPVDSRLAVGAEVNWVRQRDYDQHFSFLDYNTMTGFVSAYYDFGNGYAGALDVGRYLARDWGTTLSFERQMANGWKLGAWVTFTDMSGSEFGPGRFDKGIRLTIPLGYATGSPTLAGVSTTIRPHAGDGGARVNVRGRLYETLEGSHQGALYRDWARVWR